MAPSTLSLLLAATLPPSALAASSLFVSHYNGNLYSLALSDAGKLTQTGSTRGAGSMPSWLSIDGPGKTVYCTDEATYGNPVLNSYTVTSSNTLTLKASARSPGGELAATLYGGSDGKGYIAAAEYDPGSIVSFKLPLSSNSQFLQHQHFTIPRPGPNAQRQNAAHPHSVYTDPSGKYVLSNDLGADLVRVFAIGSAGQLNLCASASTNAGDGPRHGEFWQGGSGNLTMLYTVNELSNSVTTWSVAYGASCLQLTRKQTILNYPAGKSAPSGSKSAEVHVKGNFVYVVNRLDRSFGPQQDSVATYAIDTATGSISQVDFSSSYSYCTRTFQINAAGDLVAFAGQTSSNVAIVARNATSGKLGSLIANIDVGSPGTAGNEDGLSAVVWNE